MTSSYDFSDAVKRALQEAAMTLGQYRPKYLQAPYTEARRFPDGLISNQVPFEIDLFPAEVGDFRTWGVEGGNSVLRLGSTTRMGTIYQYPMQVFLTIDEITRRMIRGQPSLRLKAAKVLGMQCKMFRSRAFFDALKLAVDENEADAIPNLSLPSALFGEAATPLDYDMVHDALDFYSGDYREACNTWYTHTDNQRWFEMEADRAPSEAKLKWISRGAAEAGFPKGRVLMEGIPVMFVPFDDLEVQKDYADYTRAGLRYLTDPESEYNEETNPYSYRTFLATDYVVKEYTGWSPGEMQMDTPPIAAGTSGHPANGQSAGNTWYLAMIHSPIIELPKDSWDRIGLCEILHALPSGDSQV